jgi:hypothetical protein
MLNLSRDNIEWKPQGNVVNLDTRPRSSLHKKARKLLQQVYDTEVILEEVTIPVDIGYNLYLDFYIPLYKIAIEVHGKQHYEFCQRFHKDLLGFAKHKKRDTDKSEWCRINSINLIILPYNEVKEWIKYLKN